MKNLTPSEEIELQNALKALQNGKNILCPTDTIWGLSCDASNELAVNVIFKLKDRDQKKSLIVLVSSEEMLKEYVGDFSKNIKKILDTHKQPLTIIYPTAQHLAKNVFAQDGSIAIRIVRAGFCHFLIKAFGKAIVSTSANFSNQATAYTFDDITFSLKEKVDYIVNLPYAEQNKKPSSIIKIEGNNIIVIRE